MSKQTTGQEESLEKKLWKTADKLTSSLSEQMTKSQEVDKEIITQLKKVGINQ